MKEGTFKDTHCLEPLPLPLSRSAWTASVSTAYVNLCPIVVSNYLQRVSLQG